MFKKVVVTHVEVQGFKGFEDGRVFTLEEGKNQFIGDNGRGKSSVGELLAWVFTGRNLQGKQKELSIVNINATKADARVTFVDENGEGHEVRRKLKNGKTTIEFDLDPISQKKLEEMIPADLFLSIYNPAYFLSLDKDASRKQINSLLPTLTKEDILNEMADYEKDYLNKESFAIYDTNDYLKEKRQELREIEDNKKYLEGYMDKLKETIIIPEVRSFDESLMDKIQEQLNELRQHKAPLVNIQDALQKLNELEVKMTQIKHEAFEGASLAVKLEQEKALLLQQLEMEKKKEYTPFSPTELQAQLGIMRNEYKHVRNSVNALTEKSKELESKHVHAKEGDTCPYCKQEISKESVHKLTEELQQEVKKEKKILEEKTKQELKTLAELEQEGKALLAEIERAKAEDDQKRNLFEQEKQQAISSIEKRLQAIEENLVELKKAEQAFQAQKEKQIAFLQGEINSLGVVELEAENHRIQAEFDAKIQKEMKELQSQLSVLQKEKEDVMKHETLRHNLMERVEKQKKELERCEEELKTSSQEVFDIQMKINVMKSFNAKKMEIINRTVSTHLKDVKIRLQKTIESTGEIKDCFDIYYKGKDIRSCSLSESIRAGLEISHMMASLSDVEYPIFVDNAESITHYETPSHQIIEARVVEGKELTKVKDGIETVIAPTKLKKRPRITSYYRRPSYTA